MTDQNAALAVVCSGGSDGDGIVTASVAADGTITERERLPAPNPMFLAVHPDNETVYAVERVDGGRVSVYRIDAESGRLERRNSRSSEGVGPCYVSVDATGSYAFIANYQGGTVASYRLADDGRLGAVADVVRHEGSGPDPERQMAPHPHAIDPGPANRFCYVPDLGTDRIEIYRPDESGTLRPADAGPVAARPGSGPRHVAFHPTAPYCFVVDELESTVSGYERDPETGALAAIDRASTVPAAFDGDNEPADVHVHPSGQRVYVSNRGHDSVAVFAVDAATGHLEPIAHEPTRGATPRDIAFAPDGETLLASNQHGNVVTSFAIDGHGRLELAAELAVPKPVCAKFLASG